MTSLAAIAVSGVNAAQASLGAAAHNIANASTRGFQRQAVVATAVPTGGVTTRFSRLPVEGPSIETDLVATLQAKNSFLANLAVFRRSDEMAGSLLDALG